MFISRPLIIGFATSAMVLTIAASDPLVAGHDNRVQVVPAAASTAVSDVAQAPEQPWDPGCWGPFSWNNSGCGWSSSTGTNGSWVPDPFNRPGTGSQTRTGPQTQNSG